MTSLKKKIVFSLSTIALFMILLAGLEIALRLLYPNLDTPLVTEASYDGIKWYQVNRAFLKKYFSGADFLVPELKPALFRKIKTANTFRIFCIGESSMFGVPYQMTGNIPGIVRKQLRHLYPDREIEVVNFGASAVSTNVVLDMCPDLLRLQPDLILLYAGHNEFYGPEGVGATPLEKNLPFLISWKYSLRNLALVKLLMAALPQTATPEREEEVTLMKQVSQNTRVPLNSDDANRVFKRFESNLAEIIALFKKRNVPIIVSDVTSNLMFPPFSSTSDEWRDGGKETLLEAESSLAEGQLPKAMEATRKCIALDSTDARGHFLLASAYERTGSFMEAKRHYLLARDYDLLKFRAPQRTNMIIKDVCAAENVPLVSSDSLFTSLSRNGITGSDLFWEHLHPSAYGYYLIADLYVRQIERENFLARPGDKRVPPGLLPFNFDSLSICWLDLAYGDISMKNLTSKWPFRNYSVTPLVITSAEPELQRIAGDVYSQRIVWDMGCYESAQYFWKKGEWRQAETTYEALLEEYPYNFYTHYLLGSILTRQNKLADAIRHYSASITSNPNYPYAHLELALIKINLGKLDEAIDLLSKAAQSAGDVNDPPLRANIYYGLAVAYANKREFPRALSFIDEALKFDPSYRDALTLREKIESASR